jgi:hypothetical protein
MPGACVMSKLDSSNTTTMCGGFCAGEQVLPPTSGLSFSANPESDSSKPRDT